MENWLRSNALTLITAIVAVYGAVLSTLNYRHTRAEKRRRLNVRLSWGFLTFDTPAGGRLSDQKCLVAVSNPGHTPVILRSVYLTNGKFKAIVPAENSEARRLPFELQPGHECNFWIGEAELAEGLAEKGLARTVKLRALVTDGTGTDFTSKSIDFDIDGARKGD